MKKAFITGIGGFIGSHLAKHMAEMGYEVYGSYFRPTSDIGNVLSSATKVYNVDVRYKPHLKEALAEVRPDVVYHLAAQSYPMVSFKEPLYTMETNVLGTVNLFESLVELGLKSSRIMLASSTAAYGFIDPSETPVREDQPFRPAHVYGVSKASQDLLGFTYFNAYGLDIIRLRIGNCVGPGRKGEVVSDFTYRRAQIELGIIEPIFRVGNLHTKRAFLDVRDAVEGFLLLQEKGKSGEAYNISGEIPCSIGELLEVVLKSCPVRVKVVVDQDLVREKDEPIYWNDLSKIKRETGFAQRIPLERTVEDMVKWWLDNLKKREGDGRVCRN